jgi:hypothetical protein
MNDWPTSKKTLNEGTINKEPVTPWKMSGEEENKYENGIAIGVFRDSVTLALGFVLNRAYATRYPVIQRVITVTRPC